MRTRNKLTATVAAVAMWASFQPGTASAQNSSVGSDGITRLMWRNTDYHISLWNLDGNLNFMIFHEYGPFPGWIPIAITTAPNNNTYVLWRNTDGRISIWLVDANLNQLGFHEYGPFAGWIAKGLGGGGTNDCRIIWRNTDGRVSVWDVNQSLNVVQFREQGPFVGWDPGYTTE
jgi:hypothetical protein